MDEKMSFKDGLSMDLKIGWDFSKDDLSRFAIDTIITEKPWIVKGYVSCAAFNVIHNLNMFKDKIDRAWRKHSMNARCRLSGM